MATEEEIGIKKISLSSLNLVDARLAALRDLVPEAFDEEGKLDVARLKGALGEFAEGKKERYSLSWAGKQDAQRALQILSTGTLEPMREESVDFDTTRNLIIEGDNLEVLKLLQKAYHGKVKMIYIDPPYNTGNDFIYPDNFREGLQTYLEYTGQAKKKLTETEENLNRAGRVHSNWLNMMYPRLALARNLLREDGVIFVSIDDHEVHNLRMLMDEVFGEENFVSSFIWQKAKGGGNNTVFYEGHEYVVIYRKRTDIRLALTQRNLNYEKHLKKVKSGTTSGYIWKDGRWFIVNDDVIRVTFGKYQAGKERRLAYEDILAVKGANKKAEVDRWLTDGTHILVRAKEPGKHFVAELKPIDYRQLLYSIIQGVLTERGKEDYEDVLGFEPASGEEYPKPVALVELLIDAVTTFGEGNIILDFFAGSGTTAQAVMELNQSDGGNRRFILVQLPEPLDPPITLDGGTKLNTIADICRERVRRAAKKIAAKSDGKLDLEESKPDLGFRAFRLTRSNFKLWEDKSNGDPEKLAEQLELYAENILPARPTEAILFEILLKSGLELATDIEQIEVEGETVFKIAGGRLFAYLGDPVDEACLRSLIELVPEGLPGGEPRRIVCLDIGFRGNDALKANIAQQVKQWNSRNPARQVELKTV